MSIVTQQLPRARFGACSHLLASSCTNKSVSPTNSVIFVIQQKRKISTQGLDEKKGDRERVLILGSGWGGFGLSRALNLKHYQPVIVTPRTYFILTPLLASTAVGTLEFRTAMESSHSRKGVEVIRGWAESIDFEKKTVTVEGAIEKRGIAAPGEETTGEVVRDGQKFEVGWDKIVIAVGAYSQTFGIEGVKQHAFFLKDVGDARKIRRRVLECFEQASLPTATEKRKRQLLHFAIVGGGPTGVEFAAELHDLITEDMASLYPELVIYPKITVYDVSRRILSMFDTSLAGYAEKLFSRKGIEVKTNHHVIKLEDGALVTKEEGRVPVGAVVWSTGLAGNPFVSKGISGEFKLPDADGSWKVYKDPRSERIVVDDHLRVTLEPATFADPDGSKLRQTLPDAFAIGDCATSQNTVLPATAQVANQQARWLGKALNDAASKRPRYQVQGNELLNVGTESPFHFRSLGVMAYLGGWKAITQSTHAEIKGRLAWVMWRMAYLSMSVSWRNRILISTYWCINWILGRDTNRF